VDGRVDGTLAAMKCIFAIVGGLLLWPLAARAHVGDGKRRPLKCTALGGDWIAFAFVTAKAP
jgi:hypothetical protein